MQRKSGISVNLKSPKFWGLAVFLVALVMRLLVILFYQPVSYSDTPSYRRLAQAVLAGFARYDGTRTPGYPVFMALGGSDRSVWIIQLLLGLVTTMLLYHIGWKLTGNRWFGGIIGLAHTLNLGQLFFESNLLTESLTTSLLVWTCLGVLIWLYDSKKRQPWLAFLIGLAATFTMLVRPLFIYLPFYLLLFLWLFYQSTSHLGFVGDGNAPQAEKTSGFSKHLPWRSIIAFVLPVALLLGGWIGFIHTKYGDWALTTMTGYHLIQHTGNYFEYVPDEYASLRDTYIKYRDAQIALTGSQTNAIWEAIPEMSQVSGYNFYDLSRLLAKISIQLILKHPLLFLQNAIQGWWMFWRTSFYWSADAIHMPWLVGGISILVQVERALLFLVNMIFIFASLFVAIINTRAMILRRPSPLAGRFTTPPQRAYFYFLMGTIWIASILQTLLDHGDNPRFLVPLQSLVVLWVSLFFYLMARNMQSKDHNSPQWL